MVKNKLMIKLLFAVYVLGLLISAISPGVLYVDAIRGALPDEVVNVLSVISNFAAIAVLLWQVLIGICFLVSRKIIWLIPAFIPVLILWATISTAMPVSEDTHAAKFSILNVTSSPSLPKLIEQIKKAQPTLIVANVESINGEAWLTEVREKLNAQYPYIEYDKNSKMLWVSMFSLKENSEYPLGLKPGYAKIFSRVDQDILIAAPNFKSMPIKEKLVALTSLTDSFEKSWGLPLVVAGNIDSNAWSPTLKSLEQDGFARASSTKITSPRWAFGVAGQSTDQIIVTSDQGLSFKSETLLDVGGNCLARLITFN